MASNVLNSKWLPLALLSLGVVSGCCCQAYPLPGEDHCPTDARRLYLTCGEEAVRRCPCGPDREFYGLKPTSWRTWPEGWRCGQFGCSSFHDPSSCAEPVSEEPGSAECDLSNPFRSNAWGDEHPLQPAPIQPPAPQVTPPPAVHAQTPRIEQAPAALPSLEKAPLQTAPLKLAPAADRPADSPAAQNAATVNSPPQAAPMTVVPPQTAPYEAPPAQITPLDLTPPQTPAVENPPVETRLPIPPQQPAPNPPAASRKSPVEHRDLAGADANHNDATSPPAKRQSAGSTLSNRVEQHLNNNLQM